VGVVIDGTAEHWTDLLWAVPRLRQNARRDRCRPVEYYTYFMTYFYAAISAIVSAVL